MRSSFGLFLDDLGCFSFTIWAATWQNQQSECAPSEDSDQPGHLSSLIRIFAVCMKKPWFLSYPLSAQRRFWSDWADAQADLSLRWAHTHFVGFVMRWLICYFSLDRIHVLREHRFPKIEYVWHLQLIKLYKVNGYFVFPCNDNIFACQ